MGKLKSLGHLSVQSIGVFKRYLVLRKASELRTQTVRNSDAFRKGCMIRGALVESNSLTSKQCSGLVRKSARERL